MGQIRILPPTLVNRIAAGECVERPASVVKELMENSLDAGATRIDVTIVDGGRELIRVSDDGIGMDADDLRLSVAPHATSKLCADEDLFNIHTLGFRGEALASIASVARMRITSRRHDSDVGYTIRLNDGQASGPTPCAAPPGTTVEARDLFYCVPARRKFLRTAQTEMGHISEQFARISLAHPEVAMSLTHQDRPVYQLEATGQRLQRIADFYGRELADVLLPVRQQGSGILIEGYVAPPAHCRHSGKWEYVFVNGRYIRDRFVSHAVAAAYRSLIRPDEYPVVFLFVTIEPTLVDVNVHPTKIEVRWRDSNYVHGQVLAALRDKFLSTDLDRHLRLPADQEAYRESVRSAMVEFFTRSETRRTAEQRHAPARPDTCGVHQTPSPLSDRLAILDQQSAAVRSLHGAPARDLSAAAQKLPIAGLGGAEPARAVLDEKPPPAQAVSAVAPRAIQAHNAYLVAEVEDGLLIVDQHALHERILYEDLRRRLAERPLESQTLLLPVVVQVPPDRVEVLEVHAELLSRLGLALTPVGPQSVALHAFPVLLERTDATAFVRDLLDLLSDQGRRPNLDALIHDVLDMLACRAAVKAGDPLTPEEIAALLARRELAEQASHCPHGRPASLRLTLRDLERQFKRR